MFDYHDDQRFEKQSVRVESWPSSAWLASWRWAGYTVHQAHQHDKQAALGYHYSCFLLLGISNYNDMEVAVLRQPLSSGAVSYL
jgi:hypothetical protein